MNSTTTLHDELRSFLVERVTGMMDRVVDRYPAPLVSGDSLLDLCLGCITDEGMWRGRKGKEGAAAAAVVTHCTLWRGIVPAVIMRFQLEERIEKELGKSPWVAFDDPRDVFPQRVGGNLKLLLVGPSLCWRLDDLEQGLARFLPSNPSNSQSEAFGAG